MKAINLDILNKSINEVKELISSYTRYILNKKLDKLTPGKNIEINNNIISSESYTVENYGGGKHSIVNNITTSNNHKILVHKTNIVTYPKVRWARHGHIDLDNLKDIDYVLVPCRYKCLLLCITNKYLKNQSENLYVGDELGWNVQVSYLDILRLLSNWFSDEKCVMPVDSFDLEKLPIPADDINLEKMKKVKDSNGRGIYVKKPLYMYTKKLLMKRRGHWNKFAKNHSALFYELKTFNKYNLFFYYGLNDWWKENHNEGEWPTTTLNYIGKYGQNIKKFSKLTKTPYMIFRNPFTKIYGGGVIPVRNGKLMLSEYRRCQQTDKFYLVTTGEILEFDLKGRCKTILRPHAKKVWYENVSYRHLYNGGYNKSLGEAYTHHRMSHQRKGITKMKKQFAEYHFKKWRERHTNLSIHKTKGYPFIWFDKHQHHFHYYNLVSLDRTYPLLIAHTYMKIKSMLYPSYSLYQSEHFAPLRKTDFRLLQKHNWKFKYLKHIKTCIGYADPFGVYQTNRYAPVDKYIVGWYHYVGNNKNEVVFKHI